MAQSFREALQEDRVFVFDGAMGTMLYGKGMYINRCYDEINLSAPKLVLEIHQEYIKAGAEILESNTFGANRFKLTPHGLNEQLAEINYKGVKLAREAARAGQWVAGAIGPLGIRIEPWGPTSVDEARAAFKEQAEALLDGGIDLFIIETFTDLNEIHQAILAVRELCDLPIVAQMTVLEDGNSSFGTSPEIFTKRLEEWGADVIGLNCSVGPQVMLETIERMAQVTKKKLSAQPNAGLPKQIEGRNIYLASPEYIGEYAKRLILAGARFIGGCCGTTPEHIKQVVSSAHMLSPHKVTPFISVKDVEKKEERPPVELVPRELKSVFAKKIVEGKFVTSVEITPPRGADPKAVLDSIQVLKDAGVDGVNIPDGPRAQMRMGAAWLALLVKQQVGMEPILHYCCRDRNLLAMQSDLLGMYAAGLRNILIITGDPPKMGPYPDATAVFDVDAIGLTNMATRLNQGMDIGGNPIGQPTGWHIGVGVNPGATDLDHEIRRFEWKVGAGAEYAITQPVFDVEKLVVFMDRIKHCKIPVLAGIWPLTSLRNAEFMNNEVPGASVPPPIMERMRKPKTKEEGREEGLAIAREMLAQVRHIVQGAQVSAPFGKVQYALDVFGDKQSAIV